MLRRDPRSAWMHPRRVATALCCLTLVLPLFVATSPRANADPTVLLGRNRVGEYQGVRGESFLAWQQNTAQRPGQYDVFAQPLGGGERFQVNLDGTGGANGSIDDDVLVYQEFRGGSSDLYFYDLAARTRSEPPSGVNTRHWEYWPSMSGRWLLFGRLFGNGSRRLILFDLQTGETRILDRTSHPDAFIAPGQVNGNWAVWHRCKPNFECDVFLQRLSEDEREIIPGDAPRQRSPSVTSDGTVYFARSRRGCGNEVRIMRYPRGGPLAMLWQVRDGHDVGTMRVYEDQQGDVTLYFDDFTCGRPARSDVWEMVEQGPRVLDVNVNGQGTVTSSPAGIDCGNDCDEEYPHGESVTLTAQAGENTDFAGWGGDCNGTDLTCTVTMEQSRSVTADFGNRASLTVTLAGNGDGTVTGPGIDCPGDCSASYSQGTNVTLTASPDAGSQLVGWGGGCSGSGDTCDLVMDQSRQVSATFDVVPMPLTVSVTGDGTVTGPQIDCPGDCNGAYAPGANITLTASADAGSDFDGWGGACSGTGATCDLVMSQARQVTATFTAVIVQHQLTVSLAGDGGGTVNGQGINCSTPPGPSDCTQSYDAGTEVTLSAAPDGNSTFGGWTGCSDPCTVTMDQAQAVTATFDLLPPPLPIASESIPWFRRLR